MKKSKLDAFKRAIEYTPHAGAPPRANGPRIQIHASIERDVEADLQNLAHTTGRSTSSLVEEALKDILRKLK